MSDRSLAIDEALCEQFNANYPVRSRVILILDCGQPVKTTVKWGASVTINGPMVGLDYSSGSWLLERVIPIQELSR